MSWLLRLLWPPPRVKRPRCKWCGVETFAAGGAWWCPACDNAPI